MLIDVTAVEALPNFKLALEFSDGMHGVFDMAPYLSVGQYAQLADPAAFNEVRIECYTASWPGGIDIAPERLYAECVMQ